MDKLIWNMPYHKFHNYSFINFLNIKITKTLKYVLCSYLTHNFLKR